MKRLYGALHRLQGGLLAAAMLLMAATTILNVFARNVLGDTLAATEELNRFLIVLVCFVGLSYAAGEGRHIRMTALSDALPRAARRWLQAIVCVTTSALLLVFAYYAASYALDVDRRSPVMGVPLRWVYLIAPAGLFLGSLEYALAAVSNMRGPDVYLSFERSDGYEALDSGLEGALEREQGA
ncbi:MAG: TRAP transporter small permease [Planctomycetota bacterium]